MDALARYLPLLGGLIVIWVVFRLVRAILARGERPAHTVQATCACGWRGTLSRYRPVCPRCGAQVRP